MADTTLYYTFSTISQTLAGAIGLLGAFVLFRLQSVDSELDEIGMTVINCYSPSPDRDAISRLHNARRYVDMVTFVGEHAYTDPSARIPYVTSRCEQLPLLVAKRNAVYRWLRISLLHTVGLIAASVAILALTPRITVLPRGPAAVLLVGWLWLVLCLMMYAKLLGVTLGGKPT